MYLFNAKIENPEKLEQMLVGREQIVNTLVETQLQKGPGGLPSQFLVIGPRGSGKTHMLRIVYDRLSKNSRYMQAHEIAYMVEDETGIGSYFDLLQRIIEALKRWSDDRRKIDFLNEQVEHLKGLHPRDWTKEAENILLRYLDKKNLLILIENFDNVMRGMDYKDDIKELARLRDFIQQHNQIAFIATSQSLINTLSDDGNPLYGFFNVIQLKRLNLDESIEFVKKVALSENNDELLEFLETTEGKGHLEAIHEFTKGNHRLLLVFFDFLKAEFRSNLSEVFLRSIDDLKPYYDSFIRSLAPQQQKIVQYLSLQRNPQKGADIGRNCFLDKSTMSKQLSELQRLGYIIIVNEKGRDKYYEISEPLLRMCFEINEDRNGIIKLFVNFLGQLFNAEQLKEKYLHYNYLDRFQTEPTRKLYQAEARIYDLVKSQYLNSWSLNEEEEKLLSNCCDPDEAKKLVLELSHQKNSGIDTLDTIRESIKQKEWEKALKTIQNSLKTDPNNTNLYFLQGLTFGLTGVYNKAIEAFNKSIEIEPKFSSVWFNLGYTYSQLKDYVKAIESYMKAIEINPEYEKAWINLGNSYRESEQYQKAIDAYQKSIEINPNYEKTWINLGNAYSDSEQYDKAIEAYLKAIEIKPDNKKAWINLGDTYYLNQQFHEAIEACLKAIKFDPNDNEPWNILGDSYTNSEQYEKAIEAYLKSIEISSTDAYTWNNLGEPYYKTGQYNEAEKACLNAVKIKPNYAEAWINLGNIYDISQQNEKAIEAYLNVTGINPDFAEAWDYLGSTYAKIAENEKAIKAYQKAIEVRPDFAEAWNNLGFLYNNQKQFENAKDAFENAIALTKEENSDDILMYSNNLLETLFSLKEIDKANTILESFLSKPELLNSLIEFEDAIFLLVKNNSESEIRTILLKLLSLCENNNKLEPLSGLLSYIVFLLLRTSKEIKPFRLDMLKQLFEELFSGKPEFTYPLRFMDIGIRYFVKEEKEAIYEMSQEERKIFERFTTEQMQ